MDKIDEEVMLYEDLLLIGLELVDPGETVLYLNNMARVLEEYREDLINKEKEMVLKK